MRPPPTDLRIRVATVADAGVLAALGSRTFESAYGSQMDRQQVELHLARQYNPEVQRREIETDGAVSLLAEVAQGPIGFAQLDTAPAPREVSDPRAMRLARFYLEQEWIGHGVAQPLMARCQAEALARGRTTLWLTVWKQAPRPIAFYEKSGFERVGEADFVLGDEVQRDWLMAWSLGP